MTNKKIFETIKSYALILATGLAGVMTFLFVIENKRKKEAKSEAFSNKIDLIEKSNEFHVEKEPLDSIVDEHNKELKSRH